MQQRCSLIPENSGLRVILHQISAMALSRNTKIGILLTLVIVFISGTFYFYQVFFASNFLVKSQKPGWLYIPRGADFKAVKDSLEANKLVHDFLPFAFASKLLGYQDAVKPGAYEIQPNEGNLSLIRRLRSGRQSPVKLTFNSFRTKSQLADRLDQKLELSAEEILNAMQSPELKDRYGLDSSNCISLFVPDSYEVYWTISQKELIRLMGNAYLRLWNDAASEQAKALGFTPAQIMTIASIVQSETNKVDEMPRVAGVYLNRLRENMPLQADPTVVFAVGDFSIRRVLSGHKEVDSPYNTYKYNGLPPGPIAIATRQAIKAVLNPEKHDYLFFCAREDFSGYHNFTRDFNQHLKNARTYQAALNKAGIH
jgi:UPF0755 protein